MGPRLRRDDVRDWGKRSKELIASLARVARFAHARDIHALSERRHVVDRAEVDACAADVEPL